MRLVACEPERAADLADEAVHALHVAPGATHDDRTSDSGVALSLAVAFASAGEWTQAACLLNAHQQTGRALASHGNSWPDRAPDPFLWTEFADRLLAVSKQ
ncbi:hypothetical protein ACWCQK_40790 [Streptomyces sp. NPDC002306]